MKPWCSAVVTVVVLVAGTLAVVLCGSPAPAQPGPAPAAKAGRFQALTSGNNNLVVIDTETGQCWTRGVVGGGRWVSLDSPAGVGK